MAIFVFLMPFPIIFCYFSIFTAKINVIGWGGERLNVIEWGWEMYTDGGEYPIRLHFSNVGDASSLGTEKKIGEIKGV